jgi:hypothetical protein
VKENNDWLIVWQLDQARPVEIEIEKRIFSPAIIETNFTTNQVNFY